MVYNSFEEFIQDLIDNSDSKSNFQNYYDNLNEQKTIIWKKLLEYLKQNYGNKITFENGFSADSDNFFRFLNDNVDLDDYEFTAANEQTLKDFWNESVGQLVNYYYQLTQNMHEETTDYNEYSETQGKIPIGNNYTFNTEDIKKADAGNSFDSIPAEEPITIPKWVKPWYNAERYNAQGFKSYYNIRNNDLSAQAVSNSKNLHFTRQFNDSLTKWLRLLMPKNSRRVEVEDLNRNFWVISTTLTGIVGYLFSSNSPYKKIIEGSLRELLELWENTIYLWGTLGMISQQNSGLKTIMLPVPNSEWESYNKYDGFSVVATQDIINRVSYLAKKYKGFDLVIIPYNRINNYCKNCYSEQSYPIVIFYNNRTQEFNITTLTSDSNQPIKFTPSEYADRLFAIRETDTYYKYSYPVQQIPNLIDEGGSYRYFGGLRIIPHITAEVNSQGKIVITDFELEGIDAARYAIKDENYVIVKYSKPLLTQWTENSQSISLTKFSGEKDIDGNYDLYRTAVHQALYFGEFPTVQAISQSKPEFVYDDQVQIIGTGKLIKIGNYLPQRFYQLPTSGTKYYQNPDFYGEQKVPDGSTTTDYLLNITVTGNRNTQVSEVQNIYGGLGAAYVSSSERCYLFTPKVNGPSDYSLECNCIMARDMNENGYLNLGYNVIGEFIEKDTEYDTITYFVAAVGVSPWHNTNAAGNNTFQGYWGNTYLTHMFRYIPKRLKGYITTEEYETARKIYRNGEEIGALQALGKLNKEEKAFSVNGPNSSVTDTFVVSGTTWRLPQLMPEQTIQGYIVCKELVSGTIYFVDIYNSQPLLDAYNNNGIPGVISELNTNYQDYINDSNVMMTSENIKLELSSPSGIWAVFDGNSSAGSGTNQHIYIKQNDRREVANTNFIFENNILSLNNAVGRDISHSTFSSISPSYILPDTNFSTMVFNW